MNHPFSPSLCKRSGIGSRSLSSVAVAVAALLFSPTLGLVHAQSTVVTDSATSSSADPESSSASVQILAQAVQTSAGGVLFDPVGVNPTFVKADTPAAASTGTNTTAAESIEVRLRATAANGESQFVASQNCGGSINLFCSFQKALANQFTKASLGTPDKSAASNSAVKGIPGSHIGLSGSVALSGTVTAGGRTVSVDRSVSVNRNVGVAATTAPGTSSGFGFGNAMSSASSVGSGTAGASSQGYGNSLSETATSMADAVSGAANDSLGGGVGIGAASGASASVD